MGLADIAIQGLESEEVRKGIGEQGIRIFKSSFEEKQTDSEGGVLGWLWNGAKRLVGFIVENVGKLLSFSLTTLWGWFTSTLQYIWNFNWNITDTEIDQQIKAAWDALGGMIGGTLGHFVGGLFCGVLPAATIMAFNEPLGAYVMANVTEELFEEFIGNLSNLIRYTFISGTQTLILSSFKNARKFIKSNAALAQKIFGGDTKKIIDAWGSEGSKPWSFALKIEEKIEPISNTFVRNFVEESLEEAWEGCVEAGYVVANSVDSYMALEKLKQQKIPVLGKTKYVEIQPDRTKEEPKLILAGPQQILKSEIASTLAEYQLMEHKDIGVVYSFNPEANPIRKHKPQLELKFKQKKKEVKKGERRLEGQISVRLMDKESEKITMDYVKTIAEKIKAKFGGKPPFTWSKGRELFSYADWENGYQFQLLVINKAEAKRIIEQVLDIQGHSPDWSKLNHVLNDMPEKAFDSTPADKHILGKAVKQPVHRREGKVEFQYAQLFLHGRTNPVNLYDRTGRWDKPIVPHEAETQNR